MNLFLMPLWFLSGALFPAEGAAGGLRWVMRLNPLSYGLDGLRRALYLGTPDATTYGPSVGVCLLVSVAFAGGLFALASVVANGRSSSDFE
jgi:ABC-2 type transport system permease protein